MRDEVEISSAGLVVGRMEFYHEDGASRGWPILIFGGGGSTARMQDLIFPKHYF